MEKMNQTKAIKNFLLAGNTLTSREAYDLFGCTRLAAVVHRLKKAGLNIKTVWQTGNTRYGTTSVFTAYKIER